MPREGGASSNHNTEWIFQRRLRTHSEKYWIARTSRAMTAEFHSTFRLSFLMSALHLRSS